MDVSRGTRLRTVAVAWISLSRCAGVARSVEFASPGFRLLGANTNAASVAQRESTALPDLDVDADGTQSVRREDDDGDGLRDALEAQLHD